MPLPGGAMFHRRSPQQAPDAYCIRMAPTRLLKQALMLRQLFISGAVAACNMEVMIALSQKRCLQGLLHSTRAVNTSVQRVSPEFISTQSGSTVTKDELRAELERQEQRYKEVYGGEVTTYAAQPEPERKPWRKRATVQDQVFKQELEKMEKELKAEEP
jgi:hypothetical protein